MTPVLHTRSLAAGYRHRTLLADVDISLMPGQLAVLAGANGSGKSTLLRTLTGAARPLSGTVEIDGRDIREYSRRNLARRLAVVLTERGGGGALSVEECVAIGRHPHTGSFGHLGSEDRSIVAKAIADVGMAGMEKRYTGTLSDGERQKVMVARALAQQSGLIVLDEPTAFLDVAGRSDIMRLLRRLADGGCTILLSSHDIAASFAVADRLLITDPARQRLFCGTVSEAVREGALDRAFAGSGLRFDPAKGDYSY